MNPAFWLLAGLAVVALWFALTNFFIPLGKIALKKWNKTLKILNEETEITEEKENE